MDSHREPPMFRMDSLEPFVDELERPPVAVATGMRVWHGRETPSYSIPISEFYAKVHRDMPETRFWGYGGTFPGAMIEARRGQGIVVDFANQLPSKHFLPIDPKIMGAEPGKPEVRTIVHLHGGRVPPESDGYPENWYTPGHSLATYLPNDQEAALLWYHDHTMGINRLNVMAGMLGLYVVRDEVEDALKLPSGERELPLVLTDRSFTADGQLFYPISQRPGGIWVPEFFGDVALLNGKYMPFAKVGAAPQRLRVLNASNGRFYRLTLSNGQAMHQIGSDQGLFAAPVSLRELSLAPGERADLIVDFTECAGTRVTLNNDRRPILQFRTGSKMSQMVRSIPAVLRPIRRMEPHEAVQTRRLTLDEIDTTLDDPMVHVLDGKRWHDPVSEKPKLDTTEIWEFVNTTDDTHPIHLHLVRFQVLNRQAYDVDKWLYGNKIVFLGPPVDPDPNEMGWKDTVRCTPGMITRIICKFEGYPGRYVWHCHILEHEDNEMMRPYEVIR